MTNIKQSGAVTAVFLAVAVLMGCGKKSVDTATTESAATESIAIVKSQGAVVDCPLRNELYSIESPLMDILLKPEARAVVNRHMGSVLDDLPPFFASAESPSFSAILNLRRVAAMAGGTSSDALPTVDRRLRALEITDADRAARCARYDVVLPKLEITEDRPRLLLFEKMTGFRDGPSVEAAAAALRDMAKRNGWALVETGNGAAMSPDILEKFDAVIWNNVSGDVLTMTQRTAFRQYIENGGGYLGIHGSGGDPTYFWDWYVDELIGARFIGHTFDPQFQDARVVVERAETGIGANLPESWIMNDEWYAFKSNPRANGASIIATLDESSYSPVGHSGQDVSMGGDHPIAWSRCIVNGRSLYSAIGHVPETYLDRHHLKLLENGIRWVAGFGVSGCRDGEVVRRPEYS